MAGSWNQGVFEEGKAAGRLGLLPSLNPYKLAADRREESILREQASVWLSGWNVGTRHPTTQEG
jgi:hypothetical protein